MNRRSGRVLAGSAALVLVLAVVWTAGNFMDTGRGPLHGTYAHFGSLDRVLEQDGKIRISSERGGIETYSFSTSTWILGAGGSPISPDLLRIGGKLEILADEMGEALLIREAQATTSAISDKQLPELGPIDSYLSGRSGLLYPSNSSAVVSAHKILGEEQGDGERIVYVWAVIREYRINGQNASVVAEKVVPAAVHLTDSTAGTNVTSLESPSLASFKEDVKRIFPESVRGQVSEGQSGAKRILDELRVRLDSLMNQ